MFLPARKVSTRISLLIPTRNEADNIDALMKRVMAVLDESRLDMEILVVDGGSTDGTADRVRAWMDRGPVRLVESKLKRGLAGDILLGAEAATGDVVVVMDADLSHPPEKIPELVAPLEAQTHDMTIGSRYVPGGGTPGWPVRRQIVSRVAAALSWPIVGVRDPLAGFFAVRREHLLAIDRQTEGFKIGLEVLLHGDGLRVCEVPITFVDRTAGESKMSIGQVGSYLRRLTFLMGGSVFRNDSLAFGIIAFLSLLIDLIAFGVLTALDVAMGPAHLASGALATVSYYVLFGRRGYWTRIAGGGAALEWALAGRLVVVAATALLLRGGVLSLAFERLHWPVPVALMVATLAAALVNYIGNAFFVFPAPPQQKRKDLRWSVAAVGIVMYALCLRLIYIGQIDLLPEEAYYWNYAQHLDIGYLDHPPMVAWIIGLCTALLGQHEFAVRIGSVGCWAIAAFFAYRLTRVLYDKPSALRVVLLLSTLPFFFMTGFLMTPDAPLLACWAGALYFLARVLVDDRPNAWWGLGICIGLGMLSKYTISLLGPATLLYLLLDPRARRWLLRPQPYLAALLAAAIFSPVIVWNAMHEWASFAFQGSRRLSAEPVFSLHMLVASMALLLTPIGMIAVAQILFRSSRLNSAQGEAQPESGRSRRLFVMVFTLVPLAVFALFSLRHEVKLNWTGPLFLATLPAVAWRMALPGTSIGALAEGVRSARVWIPTVVATLLALSLGLHYLVLGIPGVGYMAKMRAPVGWDEMGSHIADIDEEMELETGRECLIVGMDKYFITSELAFYDRADGVEEAVGRHLLGQGSLMYERWFSPQDHTGKPAVLVSFDASDLSAESIGLHFDKVGPLQEHSVTRNGNVVGKYFFRTARGYHGM